ncbi:MAG: hypothetical protein ED859_07960 [Desulfuromonadales bacterium]|nr:MAG: hypothetical protein ED859_07960 [Desulfuromonadales bacterium]
MKIPFAMVCLVTVCLSGLSMHASAADRGVVNLVAPIIPEAALDAVEGEDDEPVCENDLVLQKDGRCCPEGTDNTLWPDVCTPVGTIDHQIFNSNDATRYCPDSDMFIVSDNKWNWFSCADSDSSPLNTGPTGTELSTFCMKHGYGYLLKIKPWGTVGCVKVGESQGDGCIEAGTCSFDGKQP